MSDRLYYAVREAFQSRSSWEAATEKKVLALGPVLVAVLEGLTSRAPLLRWKPYGVTVASTNRGIPLLMFVLEMEEMMSNMSGGRMRTGVRVELVHYELGRLHWEKGLTMGEYINIRSSYAQPTLVQVANSDHLEEIVTRYTVPVLMQFPDLFRGVFERVPCETREHAPAPTESSVLESSTPRRLLLKVDDDNQ